MSYFYLWRFLIRALTCSGRIHQSKLSRGPLQTPAILNTRLAGTVHASTGVQKEKWAHPFCGVSSKSTGCGFTPYEPVSCDCKLVQHRNNLWVSVPLYERFCFAKQGGFPSCVTVFFVTLAPPFPPSQKPKGTPLSKPVARALLFGTPPFPSHFPLQKQSFPNQYKHRFLQPRYKKHCFPFLPPSCYKKHRFIYHSTLPVPSPSYKQHCFL